MWNDYQIDPLKIMTTQKWKSHDGSPSAKTPSAILFKPDKTFHSFGYEAMSNYGDLFLDDDENPSNWFFFKNYKMLLYKDKVGYIRSLSISI